MSRIDFIHAGSCGWLWELRAKNGRRLVRSPRYYRSRWHAERAARAVASAFQQHFSRWCAEKTREEMGL